MQSYLPLFAFSALVIIALAGCDDQSTTPDKTGALRFSLTDAPAAFDAGIFAGGSVQRVDQ